MMFNGALFDYRSLMLIIIILRTMFNGDEPLAFPAGVLEAGW